MTKSKAFEISSWIVFWIVFGVIIVPSIFFIILSFVNLQDIQKSIRDTQDLPNFHTARLISANSNFEITPINTIKYFEIQTRAMLELDVMSLRHNQVSAALRTRTWMRFMSLMCGSILVVIGSVFILGNVSSKNASTGEFIFGAIKGSLKTWSPGLLIIAIGAILVAVPNFASQKIESNDTSSFFAKYGFSNLNSTYDPSKQPAAKEYLDGLRKKLKNRNQQGAENESKN